MTISEKMTISICKEECDDYQWCIQKNIGFGTLECQDRLLAMIKQKFKLYTLFALTAWRKQYGNNKEP